jgi:hypothetical protein
MPLSMCFFVSYTIDLTSFLFYIPGILVGGAIALLCVDKATSGDRVSTDVSAIRRSPAHCRHNGSSTTFPLRQAIVIKRFTVCCCSLEVTWVLAR